jgi:hypothetical protein
MVQGQTCRLARDILLPITAGMIALGTGRMAIGIGRREFISALGGAAVVWPLAARAQAQPPVIGYLAQGTPQGSAAWLAAARKGLAESGMVEGKDFTSDFRSASNIADRLPGLAAELVQRRVAVIVALGNVAAARAAKAATADKRHRHQHDEPRHWLEACRAAA